jgi:hypothetical protein
MSLPKLVILCLIGASFALWVALVLRLLLRLRRVAAEEGAGRGLAGTLGSLGLVPRDPELRPAAGRVGLVTLAMFSAILALPFVG